MVGAARLRLCRTASTKRGGKKKTAPKGRQIWEEKSAGQETLLGEASRREAIVAPVT
jgi:hypothetical protein